MKLQKVSQYEKASYPTQNDIKRKLLRKGSFLLLLTTLIATIFTGCKGNGGFSTGGVITLDGDIAAPSDSASSQASSELEKKKAPSDSPALEGNMHYISEPENSSVPQEGTTSYAP